MINTVFATKSHLRQAWDQSGHRLPITVAQAHRVTVSQVKSHKKDGYSAIQIAFGSKKPALSKSKDKHQNKASITSNHRYFKEIRFKDGHLDKLKPNTQITPDQILTTGDQIAVSSFSKGKGFTGVIKRWGFSGGPKTHGQSDRHRAPGSIGQGTTPGRVFKGKKMAGRHGNQRHTVKNALIVDIKPSGELWIKGTVPGAKGSLLTITKTGSTKFKGLYSDQSDKKEIASAKPGKTEAKSQTKPKVERAGKDSNNKPDHRDTESTKSQK